MTHRLLSSHTLARFHGIVLHTTTTLNNVSSEFLHCQKCESTSAQIHFSLDPLYSVIIEQEKSKRHVFCQCVQPCPSDPSWHDPITDLRK